MSNLVYVQPTQDNRFYCRFDESWGNDYRSLTHGKIWFPKDSNVHTGFARMEIWSDKDRYGFFSGANVKLRCPNANEILDLVLDHPELGRCSTGCAVHGEDSAVAFIDASGKIVATYAIASDTNRIYLVPEFKELCPEVVPSTYLVASALSQTLGLTYTEFINRYDYSKNLSDTSLDKMLEYAKIYHADDEIKNAIIAGTLRIDCYHDGGEFLCAHFSALWNIAGMGYVIPELDHLQEFILRVNADTKHRIKKSVAKGVLKAHEAAQLNYKELLEAY